MNLKGAIFDLDGVIVDTTKYHYRSWLYIAEQYGIEFTEEDNERLKGVSRMESLDILLSIGGVVLPDSEKEEIAIKKNNLYAEYIAKLDESELLPGAKEYIIRLRENGVKISLGSASKNAVTILNKLSISHLFDAIIDGNKTVRTKPDPQVFVLASQELGLNPADCVVFEDSVAGIQAARTANMRVVGIGDPNKLTEATMVVKDLQELLIKDMVLLSI